MLKLNLGCALSCCLLLDCIERIQSDKILCNKFNIALVTLSILVYIAGYNNARTRLKYVVLVELDIPASSDVS